MKLYKVLGKEGKPCNGGTGVWHLPKGKRPGKWMPAIENIQACKRGYHLCRKGDLLNWFNETIYEAEGKGRNIKRNDKIVYEKARLICQLNWDNKIARLFAADCASRALKRFEKEFPSDKRPRLAIKAARNFARGKISQEELDAAQSAAQSAAESAASPAAQSAASRNENAWQTKRLMKYLNGA